MGKFAPFFAGLAMDTLNPTDSRTDPQTGLPSRAAFCEDLRRRLSESQRYGNRLSIVLVNIGNLDMLVALRGEAAGNLVIRACTKFFVAATREMDLVARLGQYLFAVELPTAALMDAVKVATRLKAQIESCPLQLMDAKVCFQLTIGVAEAHPGENDEALLARAEEAQRASALSPFKHVHFHDGAAVESAFEANAKVGAAR
jgi:diguanylate cyclase (GGDEF)-like protein